MENLKYWSNKICLISGSGLLKFGSLFLLLQTDMGRPSYDDGLLTNRTKGNRKEESLTLRKTLKILRLWGEIKIELNLNSALFNNHANN